MKAVVDTNVAIAANGRNTHASLACQSNCIAFLERLVSSKSREQILIDDLGLILDEYRAYLNYRGQPGVGDLFFKYLHDHMYLEEKVIRVSINQVSDEARGFEELPPNSMDKSDRMFLAVAVVGRATIFNAMDQDWCEQAEFIAEQGVPVKQLCPEHGVIA